MKTTKFLTVALALSLLASCGGGGGGDTPAETTSTQTKVSAAAATEGVINSSGEAIGVALGFPVGPNVAADKMLKADSTQWPVSIDYGRDCSGGGTYAATGGQTLNCTMTGADTWTCPISDLAVTVVFTDCVVYVELDSVDYETVLSGTAVTTISGSVSGTGVENPPTSGSFTGILSNDTPLSIAGTIDGTAFTGTVDLGGLGYSGSISSGQDPTITCEEDQVPVIIDGTSQNCTVKTDCNGCKA